MTIQIYQLAKAFTNFCFYHFNDCFSGTQTLLSQRNRTTNVTTLSGDLNSDDVVTGSDNFGNNRQH